MFLHHKLKRRPFADTNLCIQVASHAQKYLLRQTTVSKRKSRFCLLEQAASAQGLLSTGAAERCGTSVPLVLPVFYGVPSYSGGQLHERSGLLQGGSSSSSDNSKRGASKILLIFSRYL